MVGTSSENSKYMCMKEKGIKIINNTMDGCFEWNSKKRHKIFLGRVRGGFGWYAPTFVHGRGRHSPKTKNASISRH